MSEEEPLTVRVERRPVLRRRVDDDGRMQRGPKSYVRTKKALGVKKGRFVGFVAPRPERKPTRVLVDLGIAGYWDFLLSTGHGVGLVDWTLAVSDLARLRKLHRERYSENCTVAFVGDEVPDGDACTEDAPAGT